MMRFRMWRFQAKNFPVRIDHFQNFTQVEKDPSPGPELHQFMNYYLPDDTEAFGCLQELDDQPSTGQNISELKKEIEATLEYDQPGV